MATRGLFMNNVSCRFYLHSNARLASSLQWKISVYELGKYKNVSTINRAYMPHYIRHPRISGGCLISGVLRYISGCKSAYLLLPKKKSIYFRRQINQTLSFFEFSKVMCVDSVNFYLQFDGRYLLLFAIWAFGSDNLTPFIIQSIVT